ncbi:MAG: hypothetical protein CMO44_02550 [Verrucomicrobiales bacterium]|nr:hypothetical protein [Verrucomicrobiales bacterium]
MKEKKKTIMCKWLDHIRKKTRLLQLQLQERHILKQLRLLDKRSRRKRKIYKRQFVQQTLKIQIK